MAKVNDEVIVNIHAAMDPQLSMADEVLVDIAVKIQLSPTLHDKAVQHYEAVMRHLERPESPIAENIAAYYPQGSMAAGTTIRSKDQDDLFDIDLLIELSDMPFGITPLETLALLYTAIKGPPGSRYHDFEVVQQTRCVTVYYEDMHLDVTPIYRTPALPERSGQICHGKATEPTNQHLVGANPWGFAEWFKAQTPAEPWFGRVMLRKSLTEAGLLAEAAEEVTPVPAHQKVYQKSLSVVGLQLFKRWLERNHAKKPGGRRPPSVLISRLIGDVAGQTASLIDELLHQATHVSTLLSNASAMAQKVDVRNPRFDLDILSDRWPNDIASQDEFRADLGGYIAQLRIAKHTDDIDTLRKIFADLFGERATQAALKDYFSRAGQHTRSGLSVVTSGTGISYAGSAFARAPETKSVPSPIHRNFGD